MPFEFPSLALVLLYMAATVTFFACIAASAIGWRFNLRTLLLATTAACISLAILANL